jgi:hypothetical protein
MHFHRQSSANTTPPLPPCLAAGILRSYGTWCSTICKTCRNFVLNKANNGLMFLIDMQPEFKEVLALHRTLQAFPWPLFTATMRPTGEREHSGATSIISTRLQCSVCFDPKGSKALARHKVAYYMHAILKQLSPNSMQPQSHTAVVQ